MSSYKEKILEVKQAHDIYDYVSDFGIRLQQSGVNKFKGLCPFHTEKTPSFVVDTQFQNYRCFGCGATGDIISFVENAESLSFYESLEKLAYDKGIKLDIKDADSKSDYRLMYDILAKTHEFFVREFKKLPDDHPAVRQITDRGFTRDSYSYGYAPQKWAATLDHLRSLGFKDEDIKAAGCCTTKSTDESVFKDIWSGRLMFPVMDNSGRVIGFTGRKIYDTDPYKGKYVNSKAGVFQKSRVLFNFFQAKKEIAKAKTVFLCEGQFDVIAFKESGLNLAVASSGTALTEEQALMCRRAVGESGRVVFCFDSDAAGDKASKKALETTILQAQAYSVRFPGGQDPCDYRMTHSPEEFVAYVESHQKPLVETVLENISQNNTKDGPLSVEKYVNECLEVIRLIVSPSLQDSCLRTVSFESMVPFDSLKQRLRELPSKPSSNTAQASVPAHENNEPKIESSDSSDGDRQERAIAGSQVNRTLNLVFRSMNLILSYPYEDIPVEFRKLAEVVPKEGHSRLIRSVIEFKESGKKFAPELFNNADRVMSYIVSADYLPYADKMVKEDFISLAQVLYHEIEEEVEQARHQKERERFRGLITQDMKAGDFVEVSKKHLSRRG